MLINKYIYIYIYINYHIFWSYIYIGDEIELRTSNLELIIINVI